MKTPYNRFAIIPFHCTDCHRYIWLEKYRKAEVWTDLPPCYPPSVKKKICKDCLTKYDIGRKRGLGSMAIEYLTEKDGEKMREAITSLEQEPCEDKRLYIKIFADLEPDDIAEKIYQICDEAKFPKVIESLKKYFDSEPCEDCVSREAVKDILHKSRQKAVITFEDFEELVNKLPSVTPQ